VPLQCIVASTHLTLLLLLMRLLMRVRLCCSAVLPCWRTIHSCMPLLLRGFLASTHLTILLLLLLLLLRAGVGGGLTAAAPCRVPRCLHGSQLLLL
jgi:hypothetical protein